MLWVSGGVSSLIRWRHKQFTATEKNVAGYATTTSLIMTVETLLDKQGGWLSNDVMPPSIFMDKYARLWVWRLEQARDLALIMRKEFSFVHSRNLPLIKIWVKRRLS